MGGGARFGILGPVEVSVDGVAVRIGGPREKKALAALLLWPRQVLSVDRLGEVLWDDQAPATARAQVHNTIARLRHNLGDAITRSGPGYVIDIADEQCDASEFRTRVAAGIALAGQGNLAGAAGTLRAALELWRGPALDGLDSARLDGEARRLDEERLACLERRIEVDLALGRHGDLTGELAALVREYPLRERLVELRMLALYRSGRRLEALDTFNETRVRLAQQTGLDPPAALERLHRAVLGADPALDPPKTNGTKPSSRLPGLPRRVLPRFIGRERDLAELPDLLERYPVITLTGPPGSGKTRLALELAAGASSAFADGVAFVALDTVRDENGVAAALLAVLEPAADPWSSPRENLVRRLADREALLVLDNCEHVAAGCAELAAAIVAECPSLRVLATSQIPLGLPGERVYPVGPLSVPRDGTVDAVEASEAGRMLLDRATGAGQGLALSVANAADVARVCRAVDGLPLALELAAGRLRAFSVAQIAERLDRQLELLAGLQEAARHGSLRAAIDWSHDLLTERERLVFARLSVFIGGFTLAAAEAVIADDELSAGAVMGTLGALVERSLVVVEHREDPPGEVRYRMLEALREYATQRLDASGEAGAVRERHARYFCDLAEIAHGQRRGADRTRWSRWLEEEHGNLRAAMAGAPPVLALRFACALVWFWRRFATREALEWLREVIPAASDAPAELRQRALIGAGSLALRVSIDEARDYVQRAVLLAHELADRPREVEALSFMASIEVYVANAEAVARYGDRAVELARAEGDPYLLARILLARGLTRAHVGGASSDDLGEALALFQTLGDQLGTHEVRMARAEADMVTGDLDAIRESLASIDIAAMADFPSATYWLCRSWLALREDRRSDAWDDLQHAMAQVSDESAGPYAAQRIFGPVLDLAAALALADGDVARAVTLWHAATAILTLGGTVPERPQVRLAREVAEHTAAFPEAAERGRRMGLVEALRLTGLQGR